LERCVHLLGFLENFVLLALNLKLPKDALGFGHGISTLKENKINSFSKLN
jgi:hypothetical protein